MSYFGIPIRNGIATGLGSIAAMYSNNQWDPRYLFGNNEQGAWYDPSDFTSMFQNSTGVTAVTAVNQSVGLLLDKSRGMVLGPQLLANGDFSNGTTGWVSSGSAALSASNNVLTVTNSIAAYGSAISSATTVIGKSYKIEFTFTTGTSTPNYVNIGTTSGGIEIGQFSYTVSGNNQVIFTATATTTYISLGNNNVSGATSSWSAVFIRELVGSHASQVTPTRRGTLKATGLAEWIDYDGVDDVLNTTFISSLGAACTIAIANVGAVPTVLTGQTIGTSYAMSTDNAGIVIINRALIADETAALISYLMNKGTI